MSLMKSDRTKAPKSDRIAGYAITPPGPTAEQRGRGGVEPLGEL